MIQFLSSENLLNFFDFNEQGYVYFILAFAVYVILFLLLVWIAMGIYVFMDLRKRGKGFLISILGGLVVFIFNLPGLIVYLILRPNKTSEEQEWEELERLFISQDVDGHKVCSGCRSVVKPEHLFCPSCGLQYRSRCECGELIDNEWRFCPYCKRENLSFNVISAAQQNKKLESDFNSPKELKGETKKVEPDRSEPKVSYVVIVKHYLGRIGKSVKTVVSKISVPKIRMPKFKKKYLNVANRVNLSKSSSGNDSNTSKKKDVSKDNNVTKTNPKKVTKHRAKKSRSKRKKKK